MRLQVFLSHSGACSRRKSLDFIQAGRVTVNQQLIKEPSFSVDSARDVVCLDGKDVSLKEHIYILLNKPKGVTTTSGDRFAEKIVLDFLPQQFKHLHPVGRLDKETTGLLLLTNDGDLAYRLSHPSFEVNKTYQVFLNKPLVESDRVLLQQGVFLEGKKTAPCQIKKISEKVYEIIIHEGRKRQVRYMFSLLHYHVEALERIRQGSLELGDLKCGEWRFLKKEEIAKLRRELKIDDCVQKAP
jgi:pseudouridine synthase